ncbi:MAG: AI-2E family transporter [Verrucomicrobia bacterium]|nr:AI-2E family transporter [Verrucomicrobiota bacterium]
MLHRVALGIGIILLILSCLVILQPFFGSILWAVILAVTAWPVFCRLRTRFGGKKNVAAIATSLLITVLCLVPFTYAVAMMAQAFKPVSQLLVDLSKEDLPPAPEWLKKNSAGELLYEKWENSRLNRKQFMEDLRPFWKQLASWLTDVARNVGVGLLEFSIALIICGFFLAHGEVLSDVGRRTLTKLLGPEGGDLVNLAARTIRSVMLGILGTAALQAALMALVFWLSGVKQVILLGFAGFIFASLQLSCAFVWIPVVVWLFLQGNIQWAILNTMWGIGVVGLIDNFTKPYLISRGSNLPFGIIFLGVIGGFVAYGFLGIFFGATLMAVAFRLLKEWLSGDVQEPDLMPALSVHLTKRRNSIRMKKHS